MDNTVKFDDDNKTNNLSSDNKDFIKIKFLKLFSGKNLKIVILIIVALVCAICIMSRTDNNDTRKETSVVTSSGYTNTLEYCAKLENKLQNVLSNINGAGQVKVMITVDGSPELVYAKDTDEKISSNSSGTTTSSNSSSPIIVNSNALILTENLPAVKGVIVVSSGANNVGVKLDILNAVATLLDISIDKVSVLKGV